MGAISELSKIEKLFHREDISLAVKGAALAAIFILNGANQNIDILFDKIKLMIKNENTLKEYLNNL